MKHRALIAVKEIFGIILYKPASLITLLKEIKKDSKESLIIESNCRPQYGSFEMKLLKIWVIFNLITLS
jgi:hypothetical protein